MHARTAEPAPHGSHAMAASIVRRVRAKYNRGRPGARPVVQLPQPAFLAFLASGFTPVYPCHVSPAEMRQHPIGTRPFKFVEYKGIVKPRARKCWTARSR